MICMNVWLYMALFNAQGPSLDQCELLADWGLVVRKTHINQSNN